MCVGDIHDSSQVVESGVYQDNHFMPIIRQNIPRQLYKLPRGCPQDNYTEEMRAQFCPGAIADQLYQLLNKHSLTVTVNSRLLVYSLSVSSISLTTCTRNLFCLSVMAGPREPICERSDQYLSSGRPVR